LAVVPRGGSHCITKFGGVAAPERLLQAAEAVLSAEGGFARIAELGDTA
jgi:hypothetical protein